MKQLRTIVILGNGLSSMLTALSFASIGVCSIIINTLSNINFCSDPRSTAFTLLSKNFLERIGVWNDLISIMSTITEVYVVDNKAPEMLHFLNRENTKIDQSDQIVGSLGYLVKNAELESKLLSVINKNSLITIHNQLGYHKIESGEDQAIIHFNDGDTLSTDLLVICDGQTSKARERYFSNQISKDYNQSALVFNVSHTKSHQGTAVEHFTPNGPFAILPLCDLGMSSIVWTVPNKQATILQNLPLEKFIYLTQQYFGNFLGEIKLDGDIITFPLKACITNRYFYQRLVVLADSAHIIHPLAGQGLNQGIKDIDTLTTMIHNNSINKDVLVRYQAERQDDNMAMYMITNHLNNVFSNDSRILWHMRRLGLGFIERCPSIKKAIMKYAMGDR